MNNMIQSDYAHYKRDNMNKEIVPPISVIIPVYNGEKYLKDCLDSITGQTEKDIEIICVDDGSTDRSGEMIEEYSRKDKRIQVFHQKNGGASSARNTGIRHAKGRYIYFMDCDDILHQGILDYCFDRAEKERLDMLMFSARAFFENEEIEKAHSSYGSYYIRTGNYSGICTGRELFTKFSSNAEFKPPVTLFFSRRDLYTENHIQFREGIMCEDNLFTIQCLEAAKRVEFVNREFYSRRVRPSSVMTGNKKIFMAFSYYTVIKELEKFACEKNLCKDREYYYSLIDQMRRIRDNACRAVEGCSQEEIRQEFEKLEADTGLDFYFNVLDVQKIKEKAKKKSLKGKRKSMAKVSIIIPTYNVEMYLDECLESVQRQTMKDIEIICVNDGSTDNSLEIIKKYAADDPRFIIVDKENGGYGKAMNVGLDKATGEYIGIVEPDDYVPLNMYEDLYNIAKKNDLDMLKADFFRFTGNPENGNMSLVYNHLDKTNTWYNRVFDASNEPEALRFIMNTWSGIYRRDFIEKFHIRHNETPGASFQDNGFFFQTFVHAKRAMIIDKPYYMNRRDNPNSSVNNREKVYCSNIEYDYIRDLLMEDREIWEKFKYMYVLKKFHNYMFTLGRIGDEFKKEYVQRISKEFSRSRDNGELDQSCYSAIEWEKMMFLIKDPNAFYVKFYIRSKRERLLEKKVHILRKRVAIRENRIKSAEKRARIAERRVAELESSTTFKVGKVVMFIPISIKKVIFRIMGKEA